ncbi:MAG: hypothetical protein SFY95_12650 [Planctomycetota bacterium]|nr:hypothetical protein [Planctomycetota bacterium]
MRRDPVRQLSIFRENRSLREPARDLSREIERLARNLRAAQRRADTVEDVLAAALPEALRGKARVVKLVRGVLTLSVPEGPARFVLDRWLRSGGLETLRKAAESSGTPAAVSRVKYQA